MALGPAEPPPQIQIVFVPVHRSSTYEQPGKETNHHFGHVLTNRALGALEAIPQLPKLPLASRGIRRFGIHGRGDLRDLLDMLSDRLLLGSVPLQAAADAVGQAAQLLLGKPPFFSSNLRWIESRTSSEPAAVPKPEDEAVPLIVIDDAAHRRAIVQHHRANRIGRRCLGAGRLDGHRDASPASMAAGKSSNMAR